MSVRSRFTGRLAEAGEPDFAEGVRFANASASPSVGGGEVLSRYLEKRGRFFDGGHRPTVGIGGFLLQGGRGWNQRGWNQRGWGCGAERLDEQRVEQNDPAEEPAHRPWMNAIFAAAPPVTPGWSPLGIRPADSPDTSRRTPPRSTATIGS